MGAEDNHPFADGFGPLGPGRVVGIGLTARPAGNGVLEAVENADIDIIGRSMLDDEVAKAILGIVFIGQLQDGLI